MQKQRHARFDSAETAATNATAKAANQEIGVPGPRCARNDVILHWALWRQWWLAAGCRCGFRLLCALPPLASRRFLCIRATGARRWCLRETLCEWELGPRCYQVR